MKKISFVVFMLFTVLIVFFGQNRQIVIAEKDTSSSMTTKDSKENSEKNVKEKKEVKNSNSRAVSASGTWGTVPWTFDSETGTLTFTSGGTLGGGGNNNRPWGYPSKPFTGDDVTKIVFKEKIYAPSNSARLFGQGTQYQDLVYLKEIEGWENFDTSNVVNAEYMFYQMGFNNHDKYPLTGVDLSTLDTSKMTNMSNMLASTNFEYYNLRNWDVSNVTDMSALFSTIISSHNISLDLSKWDTSNVINMRAMFLGVRFDSINFSNFNTSQVLNMNNMFAYSHIPHLILSSFDTGKVQRMDSMFLGAKTEVLDISSFVSSSSVNTSSMFSNTSFEVLSLGEGFQKGIGSNQKGLPDLVSDKEYTGNWRDVGAGTVLNPLGNNRVTSDQLISSYNSSKAGVYVRQKVTSSLAFKIERTKNTAKIVDLTISDDLLNNIKGIEISMPEDASIINVDKIDLPSNWQLSEGIHDGYGKKLYTLNMYTQDVINLPTLHSVLESLEFDVKSVTTPGTIGLKLNNGSYLKGSRSTSSMSYYYKFVAQPNVNFQEASVLSSTNIYKNVFGTLSDVVSAAENIDLDKTARLYSNGQKQVGWTSGTRLYDSIKRTKKINTSSSLSTGILNDSRYSLSRNLATDWYWGNTEQTFYTTTGATEVYNNFSGTPDFSNGTLKEGLGYLALNGTTWEERTVYGKTPSATSNGVDGYFVKFAVPKSVENSVELTAISSNAFIPQPVTIHYQDNVGNTISPDMTTGDKAYRLEDVIDEKGKAIPGYKDPIAKDTQTNASVSFPLRVSEKPQEITITYSNDPKSFYFRIERNQNDARIRDVSIGTEYENSIAMVEVRTPTNMTIKDFNKVKVPGSWGESFQNSSTSTYNSYSFVPNKPQTLEEIKKVLESLQLSIDSPVDQPGEVHIVLNTRIITSFYDPRDKKNHYYEFVKNSEVGKVPNWFEAYNYARNKSFRGLTGYLASISSKAEQEHVYNNIAKEPGWLGGTRAVRQSDGGKVYEGNKTPQKISSNGNDYKFRAEDQKVWYWADGPERGQVFFNQPYFDAKNPQAGRVEISPNEFVYEYFDNDRNNPTHPSTVQPDAAFKGLSGTNRLKEEAFLQFAFQKGGYWNDLPYDEVLAYRGLIKGFYVEYSEYDGQKETYDASDGYSAKVPQPIIVKYKNKQGQTIQGETTFGIENYVLGTQLLDKIPSIEGYKDPVATIDGTTTIATFPLSASDKAQYITITYDRALINVTISYIDKIDEKEIYKQADKDDSLKTSDKVTMTVGSDILTNLDQLISDKKIELNYYGYDTVSKDSFIRSDGKTDTIVPNEDIKLTFKYMPITTFVSVPEFVSFGSVNVANLLFNNRTFWPKESVPPVEILNTNRKNKWKLQAKMEQFMQRESDGLNMYGAIEFNSKDGVVSPLGTGLSDLLTENDINSSIPLKSVDMSDKNSSSLTVTIDDINSQAKKTGSYKGKIGWYLVDAP